MVIKEVLKIHNFDKEDIDEVIMGQVLTAGTGQNPARQASIKSGIPKEKPAYIVNQVCGSGIRSIASGYQSIKTGDSKIVIAGGQESMSLAPHAIYLREGKKLGDAEIINHLVNPIIFLFNQLVILIPFFIMIFVLSKKIKLFKFKNQKTTFLFAVTFLPIILILFTSLFTGAKIRTMWMTPFYLFFGALTVYLFQAQINLKKLKPFIIGFIFFFFLSPVLYAYASISKDDKRTDYPGKEIAIKTQYAWNQQFSSTINVVLGDEWTAGNLSYHLNSRPTWEGVVKREKLDQLKDYMCLDNICVGAR